MKQEIDKRKHGKIFGTFGFIASIIPGGWIAGLIFSIIGYRLSKAVGEENKLAKAGIWISSIFLALLLLGLIVIAIISLISMQNRDRDMETSVAASLVATTAAGYEFNNQSYPSFKQLQESEPFELLPSDHKAPKLTNSSNPTKGEIGYTECVDDDKSITGAKLYTFSQADKKVELYDTIGDC